MPTDPLKLYGTRRQVSILLGLGLTRISQLTTSGVFPRPTSSGQYDLAACVQAYIRSLRKDSTMSEEQRLLTKAKRQREELRVRRERGELIELDEAREQAFQTGRRVRDTLLSIPDRLAGELAAEHDQGRTHVMLYKELHDVCSELAAWCTTMTRPTRTRGNGQHHHAQFCMPQTKYS